MTVTIGVIGAGAWGTALANVVANQGYETLMWAREPEVVAAINDQHENTQYLAGIQLNENIRATSSLEECCQARELLISVVPAQYVRAVWSEAAPYIKETTPIVSASKGIEISSHQLLKDVFEEILPGICGRQLAFLSGPNFAREIAEGKAAAATLASLNTEIVRHAQELISSPLYKLYESNDIVGVEVGGAIKNVIAIAAGIVDGLELGHSLRASMITRGLNEMTRFGVALGADPLTFQGLSGMGDLILTCTGDLSRNRTMGLELAKGKTCKEILGSRQTVTEGVSTARALHELAATMDLDLPISEQVYQVLYKDRSCAEALTTLAARPLKAELAGITVSK